MSSSLSYSGARRDRRAILGGLAFVTVLSWAYLAYLAQEMAAMETAGMPQMMSWGFTDLLLTFLMWSVMMVGMMTPSATPLVLTFTGVNRRRQREGRPLVSVGLFVAGYLLVWVAFSALATLAQWSLHGAMLLSPMMISTSPILGGGLLVLAGVFQWTSLKRACLHHCRTPLGFFFTDWRDGRWGALVMGVQHGRYCLGCCWLLMALLFVAGVMNLFWVAAIAIFVLAEKVMPAGELLSRVAGGLLAGWGLWLLASTLF